MATTAERIAKALAECAVLTEAVRRQGEVQATDHDLLQRLEERCKTLFENSKEYVSTSELVPLCERVEKLENAREQRGVRQWQIWLAILTAIVGPIIVILIMKAMGFLSQTGGVSP